MEYAVIVLTPENHELSAENLKLKCIFGNLYARRYSVQLCGGLALVPCDLFEKAGFNPCQVVNGFMRTEKRGVSRYELYAITPGPARDLLLEKCYMTSGLSCDDYIARKTRKNPGLKSFFETYHCYLEERAPLWK